MEGAAAAPRSPETLKKAKAAIDALAQEGFITASEAATEAAALREEALAYARSVGRRRTAVLQHLPPPPAELTATIAPPPPPPPLPSAPQPRAAPQQGEPGYVEAAAQRLQRSSAPASSVPVAPRGQRGILSMPGFTRFGTHRGETVPLPPPQLRYAKALLCCNTSRGCSFSSDYPGPLKMHEKVGCRYGQPAAAAAKETLVLSDESASDSDSEDEAPPAPPAAGVGRKRKLESEAKVDGRRSNRGAKRRLRYGYGEKADALDLLSETLEHGGRVQDAEAELGLATGMLTKWKKDAPRIYEKAAWRLKKSLSRAALAKRKGAARYPAMEAQLVVHIKRYRARGRHLSIRWLSTKARALFATLFPDAEVPFLASRSCTAALHAPTQPDAAEGDQHQVQVSGGAPSGGACFPL